MVLALLLLTVWTYRGVFSSGFVWEDVDPNPAEWSFQPRALTALTMRLQIGQSAAVFHAVNLAVHLMNGLLLYAIVPSLLALTLWWLLPIQSEAVSYVAARGDLLLCTAVLMAILAFRLSGVRRVIYVALCLAGAVLAKETGAVAGGLLLLWGWAIGATRMAVALFLGTLALIGVTAAGLLPRMSLWVAPGMRPQPWFAGVQVAAMWRYLWLTIWPFDGLSIVHDFDLVGPWMAACAVGGLLGAIWIAFRSQVRPVLFAVLWVVIALLPRLLVPLPDAMSERHWMIAVLGFCLAIGLFEQERYGCYSDSRT